MSLRWTIIATLLLAFSSSPARAADETSFEHAAAKIQAATVTVRIGPAGEQDSQPEKKANDPQVTVYSGVSLGKGLLVTPLFAGADSRIRITVPGGDQAEAKPLVLDQYSGLALLEMNKPDVPSVELAESMPRVGAWVLSAAAWGAEKPIVSFGIVSGIDRKLPSSNYPPLLACDLRTAETSSGAGVVNTAGQLVGVVVATDVPAGQRGWTYAVPVRHVQRLLRAKAERADADAKDDRVVVLYSQRPTVGMLLDGDGEEIIVRRVNKDSPADKAGIQVGDQVLAVDGIKIRSVYQAVTPTMFKQPGDTMTFLVKQNGGTREIEVVLGGGVIVPGVKVGQIFQPKVTVGADDVRNLADRRVKAAVDEVFADAKQDEAQPPDVRKLLEEAVRRYLSVIDIQRNRQMELEKELGELRERLRELEGENAKLQQQRNVPPESKN